MKKIGIFATIGALAIFALPTHASNVSEGDVINLGLHELKPTQPSVGYDQIMYKLGRYQFDQEKMFDEICEANGQKGVVSIKDQAHPNIPSTFTCEMETGARKKDMKTVVIAPNGEYYLTDGHHTFNVFYRMPQGGASFNVNVVVDKDYRNLKNMDAFWNQMAKDGNTWLFDNNGEAISYQQLPTSLGLTNFANDQYRSLMYFSRGVGWNKPSQPVPFLEFYWSKEVRKAINAADFDLNSTEGYAKAVNAVSNHILSMDTNNVGGSNLSVKQMGQFSAYNQKGFDKLFKERGKVDYMLRYKTTSTANGLSYDLAAASAPALKQLDSFTLEANSSFNDYPAASADGIVNAIVEIPTGTSAKWELSKDNDKQVIWEHKKGAPRVVNYLGYPGNYGSIPRTALPKEFGGDGDPLDVIVLGQSKARSL
ncbi:MULTISPECIES: ParB-like protein, partial [Vibrio]|uniref:ParB-like protein n=1 Tax=Vibrio TaxID=662 RepID=UPI001F0ED72D